MFIGSFNIWTKQLKASTSHLLIIEAAFSLLILLSDPINVRRFSQLLYWKHLFVSSSLLLLHARDRPRCRDSPNMEPTMGTVLLTRYTLYTIQCTPYIVHYTMNNDYSILYIVYYTLHTMHNNHIILSTGYLKRYTLYFKPLIV